jgi:hypothetical protein
MFHSIGSSSVSHNTVSTLWLLFCPAADSLYWVVRILFAIIVLNAWFSSFSAEDGGDQDDDEEKQSGALKFGEGGKRKKLSMIPVKESHQDRVRRMSTKRATNLLKFSESTPSISKSSTGRSNTSSLITSETLSASTQSRHGMSKPLIDSSSLLQSDSYSKKTVKKSRDSRRDQPASADNFNGNDVGPVDQGDVEDYTKILTSLLSMTGFGSTTSTPRDQ